MGMRMLLWRGFGGENHLKSVILHPGMYEEEKLSGSICRALAEETCLFPNPRLCKSTEEGITCSHTANPSHYLVVSFCESIVRGNVVYSVIQHQVCSANDVCFMKIVKRKKILGYIKKEGEEEKLMKSMRKQAAIAGILIPKSINAGCKMLIFQEVWFV